MSSLQSPESLESLILRVAVRVPLRRTFDYLGLTTQFVESTAGDLPAVYFPGQRVRVPFGRRQVVGMVMETAKKSIVPLDQLKTVLVPIDSEPLLSSTLLGLLQWASEYYQHPIGEVVLGSLPKCLREGGERMTVAAESVSVECQPLPFSLNQDQITAIHCIRQATGFAVFCLQGVTGSGKTAVYLESMRPLLQAGKQVLVLVPEIALTPQTLLRFEQYFQVPIVSLHSELTEKQRLTAWTQAHSGHARILIGTRSAVFAPMKCLGMIIIDESHDPSFKQQTGFRYLARDVAIKRAQIEGIPVVLGSATPTLETLMNVYRRRYHHLRLAARAGQATMPQFELIDLRDKKLTAGLSPQLIARIGSHLNRQGQVLLFLNRRGYAPTVLCHHCGGVVSCHRCDARMTLHKEPFRLCCHHCGRQTEVPSVCPACHQSELSEMGVGTEQLATALTHLFPSVSLARIDRDTTRKKGQLKALLAGVHAGTTSILIGTQMVSKGHHFKHLSLVAVVDADGGLYGSDFRALERMAQLLVQVSGRAGREAQQGEVLIQTHHPGHPLLRLLLEQGYEAFASALLQERALTQLPPHGFLALLRTESSQQEKALTFLRQIKQQLEQQRFLNSVELMGPVPAPMERRAGRYRAQLLVQSVQRAALRTAVVQIIQCCEQHPEGRRVRWSLDVDPQEMM